MGRRWEAAKRLIHENGVTYNLYADPLARDRPWELDPVPLLVAPGEWQALAASLAQRARLLNLILADLYGPQRLLARRADPGRAALCPRRVSAALPQPARAAAHLLASVRGASGPLDRRTVASAGRSDAGSLGGRLRAGESDRHLADVAARVSRLPGAAAGDVFHDAARDAPLAGAASSRESADRAAEPRPAQPDYFEDAYLARYLGYTLVAGDDLAVRDNRVYLKTLGGLLPVDVILRRVYDDDCDPLELRSDSLLGVPGLVQACAAATWRSPTRWAADCSKRRSGRRFLPALCRLFAGRGIAASQRADLVVRPAGRSALRAAIICRSW